MRSYFLRNYSRYFRTVRKRQFMLHFIKQLNVGDKVETNRDHDYWLGNPISGKIVNSEVVGRKTVTLIVRDSNNVEHRFDPIWLRKA